MSSSPGRRLALWFPVAGALGLIYFVSSRTAQQLRYPGPDYLAHAMEYFFLALVLARALNRGMRTRVSARALALALGLSVAWAITDEVHQLFVDTRISSWEDVVSDTVGATLACLAFPYLAGMARRVFSRGTSPSASGGPAQLTLLTREDCHLCQEAKRVLDRVLPDHDVEFEILDVDSSRELASRYGHEIPVLLLNGSKASKLRMDETKLRRRLRPWSRLT